MGSDITDIFAPPQEQERYRIFPTKAIRILSFAPDLDELETEIKGQKQRTPPTEFNEQTHATILEIMDMLSDEEEESDEDDVVSEIDVDTNAIAP